jgi:tetratricopeptide (TPR) repeat protein
MSWDSNLDELQVLLADLYASKEESMRPVRQCGLQVHNINFSNRSIDNWHNILIEASNTNKLSTLIEFLIKDSGHAKLDQAYQVYLTKKNGAGQPLTQGKHQPDSQKVSISRMPVTGFSFFGRTRELKQMDEAWSNESCNVLSIIAWGGVGKSALLNKWLKQMSKNHYRGAQRVYAWSFYRQGTSERVISADEFIDSTLTWLHDKDPSEGSAWDKGVRLANLIRAERTLLLLDGLEPLQYPPGPEEGRLKDEALKALLRELAASNPGLCVITTRLPLTDLGNFEGAGAGAQRLDLEQLSPAYGAQILRAQGAKGFAAELQRASQEFDGHALALTLLGSYLKEVYRGDINQRHKITKLEHDTLHGNHARRVMASYEEWFGNGPEIAVLRILGLFDRPAPGNAVATLRATPAIPHLTETLQAILPDEWQQVLGRLRRAQLLAAEDAGAPDTLDTHPIVRDYFKSQLIHSYPVAWREGNSRLYEYFKHLAKELPETLQEMEPLMMAVAFGCKAGRHKDALAEVYLPRIMRGTESFTANKLNARGALLSVLSNFFENGDWGRPIQQDATAPQQELQPEDQLIILSHAGLYNTAVKGYASQEALACYKRLREVATELGKLQHLYSVIIGQWRYALVTDELKTALKLASEVYELAQRENHPALLIGAYRALAITDYWIGKFPSALDDVRRGIAVWESQEVSVSVEEVTAPIVSCFSVEAQSLWHLGFPDKTLVQIQKAIDLAQNLSDMNALAVALFNSCFVYHFCGQLEALLQSAQRVVEVSVRSSFALWLASGKVWQGWALAAAHQKDGVALMRQGIQDWRKTGVRLNTPYFLTLQAEVFGKMGQTEEAFSLLEEANSIAEKVGEYFWTAESYRLQGEMTILNTRKLEEAESYFLRALDLAERQGSLSLQLRVAMSLCRLREIQGKKIEGLELLSRLYDQFTEGFQTVDLLEAKSMLDQTKSD